MEPGLVRNSGRWSKTSAGGSVPAVLTGCVLTGCVLLLFLPSFGCAEPPPHSNSPQQVAAAHFERNVLPLLKRRCVRCHGQTAREGGLRLGGFRDLTQRNDSGLPAVVVGDAAQSQLISRVTSDDPDLRMPPLDEGRPLSNEEVATLRQWINSGAPWPSRLATSFSHWSYRKPSKAPLPIVSDEHWVQNPIDRFVLAQLDRQGISPSPRAGRTRLIRRVYLDLIGIPPSPTEVDAFLADHSPQALERVVNRILSSPAFGERWARQWLDLARYADSNGYQADQFRSAWAFRDWVVRALNDDMPFDRFTIEQLAGDLLPEATVDQRVATGFHRCPTCNVEAGVDPEENRVNQVVDRVNTTGTVWLGTTLECAQCHNHKYDPLTQQEYYQLFAFFNNTPLEVKLTSGVTYDFFGPKVDLPLDQLQTKRRAKLESQIVAVRNSLTEREAESVRDQPEWEQQQLVAAKRKPETHVLDVSEFSSAGGATFTELADKSILIGGPNPDIDTYTVTVRTDLTGITGFRIEGLLDDSLPGTGPGRQTVDNRANFVLTDLRIHACDCEDDSKEHSRVNLHGATADVEDPRFRAANVLDSDPKSGWSIHRWYHKPHHLTVLTTEPVGFEAGTRFVLRLDFQYGQQRSIGRLRLSAITGHPGQNPLPAEILATLHKPVRKRSQKETAALVKFRNSSDGVMQSLRKQLADLEKERNKLRPESTLIMVELDDARMTNIMRRGDFLNKGAPVAPATPSILHRMPDHLPRNRLGLARWLVSPENPLVARVTVNRWWAEMFGQGIVASLEDFGRQGETPTHPELLDWLAVEFVESGWSMKHMLRLMVTSATYQQSSRISPRDLQRDPKNRLLARAARFRLPAETIRDNALTVSGLLSGKLAGPPVYPPQPPNVWRHVGRNAPKYVTSQGVDRYRRGIYTVWRRSAPYPSFVTFDAPDRGACVVNRSRTNTPLQALNLLNDQTYVEMGLALSERILRDEPSSDPAARIDYAFRLCLARLPTDRERQFLTAVVREERSAFRKNPGLAAELVNSWKSARDLPAEEVATWYRIAEVLLNLDESITRS